MGRLLGIRPSKVQDTCKGDPDVSSAVNVCLFPVSVVPFHSFPNIQDSRFRMVFCVNSKYSRAFVYVYIRFVHTSQMREWGPREGQETVRPILPPLGPGVPGRQVGR